MAAEVVSASGIAVDVYESKGSVGRKFLLAGKGGLNLTHSEPKEQFVARYGDRAVEIARWLACFDADAIREWVQDLGFSTFIGTSGRVFPTDMQAAPLLRAWVRRLRAQGVGFHVNHRCTGFDNGALLLQTPGGTHRIQADAIVLALGGASWPQLGSDGRWVQWFDDRDVAPLKQANCGFDCEWSAVFAQKYSGHPIKSAAVSARNASGELITLRSEFVVTATGIEGSAIYALSARLRDAIERDGETEVVLDLVPDLSPERIGTALIQPRKGRSLTEHLRRTLGIDGVKIGLIYECVPKESLSDATRLCAAIKSMPLKLLRPRPIEEAISTAGGVRFAALDSALMLRSRPGVFCAGEMLDWEAPTGGYLLTACFASGRIAGRGVSAWLNRRDAHVSKQEAR